LQGWAHRLHQSERERERKREREEEGEREKESGRERKRERERERDVEYVQSIGLWFRVVIFIFKRNDGCLGTF
jgi:hypothetical protein